MNTISNGCPAKDTNASVHSPGMAFAVDLLKCHLQHGTANLDYVSKELREAATKALEAAANYVEQAFRA